MRFSRSWILMFALALAAGAKDSKPGKAAAPVGGVKTPGVLIPWANLKSDASFALASAPVGFHFGDGIAIADSSGIRRFDAKTNKPYEPSRDIKEVQKACGGLVSAFSFVWTATCGKPALAKLDIPAPREPRGRGPGRGGAPSSEPAPPSETAKVEAKPDRPNPGGVAPPPPAKPPALPAFADLETAPSARAALAASDDSLWLLADAKTSLQRIDPKDNAIVAEIRLPSACTSILFAENSLWVACPGETKVLRIDPKTNLVDKRIEVSAQPVAVAAGEGSLWVLCRKDGKIARIDPKTNKVSATIDLGIPDADGTLAFGEGALWASVPGFPVMRIAPAIDKVVQQFHGEGGGVIAFGAGSVWVGSEKSSTLLRFDPKRIQATLAE